MTIKQAIVAVAVLLALPFVWVRAQSPQPATAIVEVVNGERSTGGTSFTTRRAYSFSAGLVGVCFTASSDADGADSHSSLVQAGQVWMKAGATTNPADRLTVTAWRTVGRGGRPARLTATVVGGADEQSAWSMYCIESDDLNAESVILDVKRN